MAGEGGEASPGLRLGTGDLGLLVALGGLWGSGYLFIRQGIVLGASPLLFAAARYALSAGAFAALAALRREPWPEKRALLVSALVGGVLFIGFYGGFLYSGEQYTTGGYASVLASTAPILTVVVAYFLLREERLGPTALAGVGLGFAGVVVLVVPELGQGSVGAWPGPALILAAFVSTAFGTVLLRRYGGGRQGLWQIGSQFAVGSGLLLAVGALLPGPERFPGSLGVLGSLGLLVVFSSVGGYFVYFRLHHRVGPVRANIVAYLLPLFGVGIGSGLLGEPVTVWEVAGFLVVIAGVTFVVRGSLGDRSDGPVTRDGGGPGPPRS